MLLADMNIHWYLPPLIIAISLVYSATRYESWPFILGYAVRWSGYILSFLGGTYIVLYLVSLELDTVWYVLLAIPLTWLMFGRRSRKDTKVPAPAA